MAPKSKIYEGGTIKGIQREEAQVQIEVFKILNGYENIDSNIFFEIK